MQAPAGEAVPRQGRHEPLSLIAMSETPQTAFFFLGATIGGCEAIDGVQPSKPIVAESLAIRFSFLCLYWQKEKAD